MHHIVDGIGLNESEKRKFASENVPSAENGALLELIGAADSTVGRQIVAVYVGEHTGIEQSVIKSGIENGQLFVIAAFNFDSVKDIVPHIGNFFMHHIKGLVLCLGIEVVSCALDVDIGFAYLEADGLCRRGKFGIEPKLLAFVFV